MKTLKKIVIALLIIIAIPLIIALFLPKESEQPKEIKLQEETIDYQKNNKEEPVNKIRTE